MRRRLLDDFVKFEGKHSNESNVGDFILYNNKTEQLSIFDKSEFLFYYKNYTPVGVVVVPGTHNVYGTGECGVIGLKPLQGSNFSSSHGDLTTYNKIPYVGYHAYPNDIKNTINGMDSVGKLPSDVFDGINNPYDKSSYWSSEYTINNLCPSPYLTNGNRNPTFYQTSSPSSSSNALSDFKGKENCKKIVSNYDYDSSTNDALNSSQNYSTVGTKQGEWYIPSLGEIAYLLARYDLITYSFSEIINNMTNDIEYPRQYYLYLTSTRYSGDSFYNVNFENGLISNTYHDFSYSKHNSFPFIRLKI